MIEIHGSTGGTQTLRLFSVKYLFGEAAGKALLWVENITDFWRFCYLNIPCLRINIALIFMSSSSEEFTHK